jgi:acetoin utilization deacetylase AcuC-like enzyme
VTPIFYTDQFLVPLPAGHRFPMAKYALLRERLLTTGAVPDDGFAVPPAASDTELTLVHTTSYVREVVDGTLDATRLRRIGLPWSAGLVERSRRSVGATIAASRWAADRGLGITLAGGTHHAFANRGEGFCVFNDVAVAARSLKQRGTVDRVLIIDLDVHQGNGTAHIFRDDPGVFTFDIHASGNFPFRKERADLDLSLEDGTADDAYLEVLREGLARIPDPAGFGIAFYLAGADPYSGDRLGRLALSKAGLARRDRMVFEYCRNIGLPVAVTMAGGYASDIADTVDIQTETVRTALRVVEPRDGGTAGRRSRDVEAAPGA